MAGALLTRSGKIYKFSGPKNNWNHYYSGLEAIGRFFQQNKLNLEPGFDEKESGLKTLATHKKNMLKKSEFVDNLKFEGSSA